MSNAPEPDDLEKVRLENEMAMRRAHRLVEFMDAFYRNGVPELNPPVETAEDDEKERADR